MTALKLRSGEGEAPGRPTITEKDWQARILDIARMYGWATYHPFDSRRSTPGWPDLTLVKPPRLIFAELKTERGRLTPQQRDWLTWLDACGQTVTVWRPSHMAQVVAVLGPRGLQPSVPAFLREPQAVTG